MRFVGSERRRGEHMSVFAIRILLFEWAFVCLGTATSIAQTPSFDCGRASLPDEVAICQTQELARLDGVVAAAYSYLKSSRGRPIADQIGNPLGARARRACTMSIAFESVRPRRLRRFGRQACQSHL